MIPNSQFGEIMKKTQIKMHRSMKKLLKEEDEKRSQISALNCLICSRKEKVKDGKRNVTPFYSYKKCTIHCSL